MVVHASAGRHGAGTAGESMPEGMSWHPPSLGVTGCSWEGCSIESVINSKLAREALCTRLDRHREDVTRDGSKDVVAASPSPSRRHAGRRPRRRARARGLERVRARGAPRAPGPGPRVGPVEDERRHGDLAAPVGQERSELGRPDRVVRAGEAGGTSAPEGPRRDALLPGRRRLVPGQDPRRVRPVGERRGGPGIPGPPEERAAGHPEEAREGARGRRGRRVPAARAAAPREDVLEVAHRDVEGVPARILRLGGVDVVPLVVPLLGELEERVGPLGLAARLGPPVQRAGRRKVR
ncbi:hypothetical protein THAOC_18379, partial [Thalassiosira oceanica]